MSRYECKDFNGYEFKKDMLLDMINKKEMVSLNAIFVYGCNLIGISAFSAITDISRTTIYKYLIIPQTKYTLYTLKKELPKVLQDKIIEKLGI